MTHDGVNKRIDEPTGTSTVGHEWDGIEELDTPMPRWWLWTLYGTIIWAIAYAIAYPAWPMLENGTEGMLGWTSRGQLAEEMSAADQGRSELRATLARIPIERISEDSGLMAQAVSGGAAAFRVNCVQCHGSGAAGSAGYPNLADDDWLWGGDLKAVEYTLVNGIREQNHPQTRLSQMPAFTGILDAGLLTSVVDHVVSLNGQGEEASAAGAQLFVQNCALCHGAAGEGSRVYGAPALNDAIWLYGSDRAQITQQILAPRMGMMPAWDGRLDPVTIKMLAAYVHSLGGGEDFVEVAANPAVNVDAES